jgi:tyrosine-protein kinase Etk/Wzc
MSQNHELKVNLLEVLEVLVRRKRFILGLTFIVSAVTAVYTLVVSERYVANVVVMPPGNSDVSSLTNIIRNTPLGKIGGIEAIAGGMPNDRTNIYLAILSSRSIRMDLVKKFDLVKVYEFDQRPNWKHEDLLKRVDRNIKFGRNRDGTLFVAAQDEDPARAAGMANYFVEQLDTIYKRLMNEKNRNYRLFLEERLQVVKGDLEKAEGELLAFQKKYKMVDVAAQAKATVATGVNLEANYLVVQGNLEVARKIYSDDHPKVRELEMQLKQLDAQRRRLSGEKVSDFLLPYQQTPDLALKYLRLERELEIQRTIFELMIQQHEQAKFEESKNTPTVQVLDPAIPPQKRVFPKRRMMVQIAFALSLLTGSLLVLLVEAVRRYRLGRPEEAARLGRLWKQAWTIRNR